MKLLRLGLLVASGSALWATYQPTYTDALSSIDPSKWSQNGSLQAAANGITGSGSLISSVPVSTGSDYDVSMTIHSAAAAACTGSYSLYARSTPNGTTAYVLRSQDGSVGLYRELAGSWTLLTWMPYPCVDGTVMRLIVRGANVTFWSGPNTATYQDATPIASGQPGVGVLSLRGDTVGNVQIGPIDYQPPAAVTASSVESSVTPNRVDLRWPASSPDANSSGLQGYIVYRDGVYLGSPHAPYWADLTVSGPETATYSIFAVDQHGSMSTPATVTVVVPEGIAANTVPAGPAANVRLRNPTAKSVPTGPSVDQREVGVRATGTYWGTAGENIDLLSGNLNFSIPLIKAMGRGGSSVTFALSYNSQMWRQDTSTLNVFLLGEDVGAGLGWTLQAGSILPIWSGGSVIYYQYTDQTGAQYVLDQNNGSNVWGSLQGIYIWFDANNDVLHFRDGSFWNMNILSASVEQDGGTLYPSQMEDSNGNFISLANAPAIGYPWYDTNTSSRITAITDARGAPPAGSTYSLSWSGSGIPHLTSITNAVGTSEHYTFSTTSQSLLDPFKLSSFGAGTATVLQSITAYGLGVAHQFTYDSSAEMTRVITPLGGQLHWSYVKDPYTARNYRCVYSRTINSESLDAFSDQVYIGGDSNPNWHGQATVTDTNTGSVTTWTFSTLSDYTAGLVTTYTETDINGTDREKVYTWALSGSSNPFVASLVTKLTPGSVVAWTTTTQQVDAYGNLTQQQITDYSGSPTGTRTYNMTYQTQYWGWPAHYILNRLLTATVTPAGGSPITLANITYDATCGGFVMTTSSATNNHDPAYTASGGPPRGNPWWVAGMNSGETTCTAYDSAGVPYYTSNASGQSTTFQSDSSTNFSLPISIQPNGNSSMATTASYASSWAPVSMKGPNGDQGTTTYDSYGRPSQTTTPDGAVTTYTYTYSAGGSTQTATVDGRWQTTTLDGFGRAVQVQKGNGSTVISTVQTQYAPAATTPMGMIAYVSEPYAPSTAANWTSYTYDGSGRKLTVVAPDNNSTTTYYCLGNTTTVTDPAGKIKTSTFDAYGNLVQVVEDPTAKDPGGLNLTTNYSYTAANQLTGVSMTRGAVTQTRTFLYTGSDLTSENNPENGTTTYAYDNAHHLISRTDQMGNQTQYTYDSYGRLNEVQYFPISMAGDGWFNGQDLVQRVTYSYDSGANGIGRLTGATFGGGVRDPYSGGTVYAHSYTNSYAYNAAGRVITQTSTVQAATGANYYNPLPVSPAFATMTVGYQWDNEGRMTSMSPSLSLPTSSPTSASFPTMGYSYDVNGRLTKLTSDSGSGPQTFATASYTTGEQLAELSYGGMSEINTYNSMMQLIHRKVAGYLDMTYNYSATANNGRIGSSVDAITGETTAYTYDVLNRLTGASNSLWSGTYQYDGFGNLTSKSGSGGSPNVFPSMTATYNSNNQLTTATYDADGNTVASGAYTYGYTVENKRNSQTATGWPWGVTLYGNDPEGHRVMKFTNPDPNNYNGQYNPAWEFNSYMIGGQRLVTIDCNNPNVNYQPGCWVVGENVYFQNRLLVSNGVYVTTDRLGTVRTNTQGEAFVYYPYGEERTSTVNGRDKFGTYFRDAAGQDYAHHRYYNSGWGRFWTVDPAGLKAVRLANPTSWNHYMYSLGDPVNFFDPVGKNACEDGTDTCSDDDCDDVACYYDDCGDALSACDADDGDGGGGCAADTCITVTATQALVPTVTAPLPGVLPPTFTDTVVGFFNTVIGYVGNTIGATVIMVLNPTPTAACDTLSCQGILPGQGKIPMTVTYVEGNCTAVGPPVVIPSTKRGNKGGQSIEQEYICPDGNPYTIHTLTGPNGNVLEQHVRPGKPKYGPPGAAQ